MTDQTYDYVFGFGSIINTTTHAPWLATKDSSDDETPTASLPGQPATLLRSSGFRRRWNFRSATGFTALGITRESDEEETSEVNGVLFRITPEMLSGFDRREIGYDRVEIPLTQFRFMESSSTSAVNLDIGPNEKIWLYIPQKTSLAEADEDHPVLQSYVDTVLQGCLEWGGEEMCKEFVATTSNWSPYFLNDTPSSRRPWLFRKEYNTIDRILSQNPITHFADRRHPEEFASAFLIKMMRGSWNVPRRNPVFTGRDAELGQIHARLTGQRADQNVLNDGVAKLEITGMGGVGKSQICIEYCYRYFPSYFGTVIWLNAQTAEVVAAGYRQLMADTTGMDVDEKDTDDVVAEVKARLFRSKIPWLLIFDNLEDPTLLEKFVPAGSTCGHVLVTTRLLHTDTVEFGEQTMIGCFQPSESVELLCRAAGQPNICREKHMQAARQLAEQLGHLPLALGMAAAYMRRCDVDCSEYLARYVKSEKSGALLGHEAVSSSLSLSLNAIKNESHAVWEALRLLGWLGPNQITKKLLRSLLIAKEAQQYIEDEEQAMQISLSGRISREISAAVGGASLISVLFFGRKHLIHSERMGRNAIFGTVLLSCLAIGAGWTAMRGAIPTEEAQVEETVQAALSRHSSSAVFEQTDHIWNILKSFSLLIVKEGEGNMHRLLAQALRVSQSKEDGPRNLEICLRALLHSWTFSPEEVDTWQGSAAILEHVKVAVNHAVEKMPTRLSLETAVLAKEAGVYSAMALNRFAEAQFYFEQSLKILESMNHRDSDVTEARAAAFHELGRVFRYQGQFRQAQEALQKALDIRNAIARKIYTARYSVAATLHELGVLEVKKHHLDTAASFLQKALDLRRGRSGTDPCEAAEADCASSLHQLAAVQVAKKPPSLDKAESLLQEALLMTTQIGQRAATFKQLARVAIRRGECDLAEQRLSQALELYLELYGENTFHINIAAVQFQQGALALQRNDPDQAWVHFSECLRARRHVYAYAQGNHLEVSLVLHELGRVAMVQHRIDKACEMFMSEKTILDQLYDSSTQQERLLQARLTNLTWILKCSKERGDEEEARRITAERSKLKHKAKEKRAGLRKSNDHCMDALEREALQCRLAARQFALAKRKDKGECRAQLKNALESLSLVLARSNGGSESFRDAVANFHDTVSNSLSNSTLHSKIFKACDDLRDVLRHYGLQVNDSIQSER